MELETAQKFQLNPSGETTICWTGCLCLCQCPREIVPIFHVINSNGLQSEVRWTYKTPQSNLSNWTSSLCFLLCLSQICLLEKRWNVDSPIHKSFVALTDDPVTHPRWTMYKDSKLCMREIKCIRDKSFPSTTAKFANTHAIYFLPFLCLGSGLLHRLTLFYFALLRQNPSCHSPAVHCTYPCVLLKWSHPTISPVKIQGGKPQACRLPHTTGFPEDWMLTSSMSGDRGHFARHSAEFLLEMVGESSYSDWQEPRGQGVYKRARGRIGTAELLPGNQVARSLWRKGTTLRTSKSSQRGPWGRSRFGAWENMRVWGTEISKYRTGMENAENGKWRGIRDRDRTGAVAGL